VFVLLDPCSLFFYCNRVTIKPKKNKEHESSKAKTRLHIKNKEHDSRKTKTGLHLKSKEHGSSKTKTRLHLKNKNMGQAKQTHGYT
jgi:hypothetical protein